MECNLDDKLLPHWILWIRVKIFLSLAMYNAQLKIIATKMFNEKELTSTLGICPLFLSQDEKLCSEHSRVFDILRALYATSIPELFNQVSTRLSPADETNMLELYFCSKKFYDFPCKSRRRTVRNQIAKILRKKNCDWTKASIKAFKAQHIKKCVGIKSAKIVFASEPRESLLHLTDKMQSHPEDFCKSVGADSSVIGAEPPQTVSDDPIPDHIFKPPTPSSALYMELENLHINPLLSSTISPEPDPEFDSIVRHCEDHIQLPVTSVPLHSDQDQHWYLSSEWRHFGLQPSSAETTKIIFVASVVYTRNQRANMDTPPASPRNATPCPSPTPAPPSSSPASNQDIDIQEASSSNQEPVQEASSVSPAPTLPLSPTSVEERKDDEYFEEDFPTLTIKEEVLDLVLDVVDDPEKSKEGDREVEAEKSKVEPEKAKKVEKKVVKKYTSAKKPGSNKLVFKAVTSTSNPVCQVMHPKKLPALTLALNQATADLSSASGASKSAPPAINIRDINTLTTKGHQLPQLPQHPLPPYVAFPTGQVANTTRTVRPVQPRITRTTAQQMRAKTPYSYIAKTTLVTNASDGILLGKEAETALVARDNPLALSYQIAGSVVNPAASYETRGASLYETYFACGTPPNASEENPLHNFIVTELAPFSLNQYSLRTLMNLMAAYAESYELFLCDNPRIIKCDEALYKLTKLYYTTMEGLQDDVLGWLTMVDSRCVLSAKVDARLPVKMEKFSLPETLLNHYVHFTAEAANWIHTNEKPQTGLVSPVNYIKFSAAINTMQVIMQSILTPLPCTNQMYSIGNTKLGEMLKVDVLCLEDLKFFVSRIVIPADHIMLWKELTSQHFIDPFPRDQLPQMRAAQVEKWSNVESKIAARAQLMTRIANQGETGANRTRFCHPIKTMPVNQAVSSVGEKKAPIYFDRYPTEGINYDIKATCKVFEYNHEKNAQVFADITNPPPAPNGGNGNSTPVCMLTWNTLKSRVEPLLLARGQLASGNQILPNPSATQAQASVSARPASTSVAVVQCPEVITIDI